MEGRVSCWRFLYAWSFPKVSSFFGCCIWSNPHLLQYGGLAVLLSLLHFHCVLWSNQREILVVTFVGLGPHLEKVFGMWRPLCVPVASLTVEGTTSLSNISLNMRFAIDVCFRKIHQCMPNPLLRTVLLLHIISVCAKSYFGWSNMSWATVSCFACESGEVENRRQRLLPLYSSWSTKTWLLSLRRKMLLSLQWSCPELLLSSLFLCVFSSFLLPWEAVDTEARISTFDGFCD